MTKPRCIIFAAVMALAVRVVGAQAWAEAIADSEPRQGWVSEVRLGVLAHDQAPIVKNVESGTDLNVELLFTSPRGLREIGAPRPIVGATLASEGTSHVYAGLSWEHDFGSRWFVLGSLGLAVHDGDPLQESEQTPLENETEKALGCRVNFHWALGAGYRLSRRWNVAAHYEHLSNATLCGSNGALENVGVRVGWVF